jgi:hypothetical protein
MSLRLLQAVLSSNHTKSSTRLAQFILALHACSRCGRVYCGIARLAKEMNVRPRNAQAALQHLRDEKCIETTGEQTEQGVPVYRLVGVMNSSPDEINRDDEIIVGGTMKSCKFCRGGTMKSSSNRQVVVIDKATDKAGVLAHEEQRREATCTVPLCQRPRCPHNHERYCAAHAGCQTCPPAEAREGS